VLSIFCSPARYTQGKNATTFLGREMVTLGMEGLHGSNSSWGSRMSRKGTQMRMKLDSVTDNLPSPDMLARQNVEAARVILPNSHDLPCQWAQNLAAARSAGESTPTV
jgi:hypothetical protein